jgi:hypothetical protein
LTFRQIAIENFELEPGEPLFDFSFAVLVSVLDARNPKIGAYDKKSETSHPFSCFDNDFDMDTMSDSFYSQQMSILSFRIMFFA